MKLVFGFVGIVLWSFFVVAMVAWVTRLKKEAAEKKPTDPQQ